MAESERRPLHEKYKRFFELAERTQLVHLHPTVPLARLTQELSRYDFGLCLTASDNGLYDEAHLNGCGSGRLADYLEAGLGVIISRSLKHQDFVARRYTVTLHADEVTASGFREKLLDAKRRLSSERKRRFDFTIHDQAHRLGSFYRKVGADHAISAAGR